MKRRLRVAGLVLVATAAVGCGGSDGGGAPTDASEGDFCGAFESFGEAASGAGDDTSAQVEAFKAAAEELSEVGTPEGIPDDARDGFELFIDVLADVDADATEEELEDVGNDLDEEDDAAVEAFIAYASETCAPA